MSRFGRAPRLRVLMVASEVSPWAKTGGLADVLAGLPEALVRQGHSVTTVLPRYRGVDVQDAVAVPAAVSLGSATHGVTFLVLSGGERHQTVFVDSPAHFDRDGFYETGGREHPDNAERFGLLAAAALDFAARRDKAFDVIHAHDWQTGLVPVLRRIQAARWPSLGRAGTVFTVHNLAYQGLFPPAVVPALGLPWEVLRIETGEFWGQFGFLKAGITSSDQVTTVSPTYANETRRPEGGAGLDGVLRALGDRYVGILNGIDTTVWNPRTDPLLPASYGLEDLLGKRRCKRALLERMRLPVGDDALARPLIGMVSRLVPQKGLDLIEAASEELAALDASWVFVGSGEARYEQFLRRLAAQHPSRIGVFIGFDEALAHLVEAGSDMFLMPSSFEPCGLNQMYSLRYGTVPIVRGVGGLEDTIRAYTPRARHANGFKFDDETPAELLKTVRLAVRVFRDRAAWLRLMREGMAEDHSWDTSAREYVKVYRRARHDEASRGAD